jgi:hypothetical protein
MPVREPYERAGGRRQMPDGPHALLRGVGERCSIDDHLNKGGQGFPKGEEGRPLVKENISTHSTQSEVRVSQGLTGVRKAAMDKKGQRFTALLHHRTVVLLRDGFFALKRKAAPGVDGLR